MNPEDDPIVMREYAAWLKEYLPFNQVCVYLACPTPGFLIRFGTLDAARRLRSRLGRMPDVFRGYPIYYDIGKLSAAQLLAVMYA